MSFPFTGRVEVAWLLVGEITYVYYLVLRLKKGLPRLLALLPLLPPSLLVPWRASTPPERIILSCMFVWLLVSKLLLIAWDAGPAADAYALSRFPRFFSAMTFGVHLKRDPRFNNRKQEEEDCSLLQNAERKDRNSQNQDVVSKKVPRKKIGDVAVENSSRMQASEKQLEDALREKSDSEDESSHSTCIQMMATSQAVEIVLLRSLLSVTLEASLLGILLAWKHLMSEYVLVLVLGFSLYFSLSLLSEVAAGIPAWILGAQLQPQFNMPFLADSLADFWGRRWNLLVNNLLRVSVYEPMLSFLCPRRKPTPRDRAISTAAVFLVSGLMHELALFYATRTRPSWEMSTFFLLNGAGTIMEGFLTKSLHCFRVPRLLRRAYTLSFVYFTGCWFFFQPLIRSGMVDVCLADLRQFINWILDVIKQQHSWKTA